MFAIFKKELRSYFINAIGYVFVGVFLSVAALLCCYTTIGSDSYDTSTYFTMMIFAFIVLIPLLTMKLFAEEKKLRTEQLLMTAPVSIVGIVMAKFLAAFTMFGGSVLVSCLYYLPMFGYGEPNVGKAVGGLIAMLLIGMSFIAVGLFVSSLTESAVTACIGTMGILAVFAGVSLFNSFIDSYFIRYIFSWISVYSRYNNFMFGVFDISATVYYLSITAVFLFLSVRIYERRRYA